MCADFHLCAITEKARHCATCANVVFKSSDKWLLRLHTIDIGNKGFSADKYLGTGLTTVNGRHVGKHGIRGNGFITTLHIESRVRRIVMLLENGTMGHMGVLGSILEGLLDGLGIRRTKQRTQFIIVQVANLESMGPCISRIVTTGSSPT